jgi:hypothetical protein
MLNNIRFHVQDVQMLDWWKATLRLRENDARLVDLDLSGQDIGAAEAG